MYQKALQFAYRAHHGQVRKQSLVPYIVHPIRVASCFNDDLMKTIAILHDVVEDTGVTLLDIKSFFGDEVERVIDFLTKREGEKHFDYIRRLKNNDKAVEIKITDIVDNLSDTICVCPPSMVKRYQTSLAILLD